MYLQLGSRRNDVLITIYDANGNNSNNTVNANIHISKADMCT